MLCIKHSIYQICKSRKKRHHSTLRIRKNPAHPPTLLISSLMPSLMPSVKSASSSLVCRDRCRRSSSGGTGIRRSRPVPNASSSASSSSSADVPWRLLMTLSIRSRGGPELRRWPFFGGPAVKYNVSMPVRRYTISFGDTYKLPDRTT